MRPVVDADSQVLRPAALSVNDDRVSQSVVCEPGATPSAFSGVSKWNGTVFTFGAKVNMKLMLIFSGGTSGGNTQGVAVDSFNRLYEVSGTVQTRSAGECQLNLKEVHGQRLSVRLTGTYDCERQSIQGSTLDHETSLTGEFRVLFDGPGFVSQQTFWDSEDNKHLHPLEINSNDLAALLRAHGLHDSATAIERSNLSMTKAILLNRNDWITQHGLEDVEADRIMRVIGWLLTPGESLRIHRALSQGDVGQAMQRFQVVFSDALFSFVCGLGTVFAMPLPRIHAYVNSGGAEAARMTGALIPRHWAKRTPELRQSISALKQHSMRHPALKGQDLLLMSHADLMEKGLYMVVLELFDFFREYVYFLRARGAILRRMNIPAMLRVSVQRDYPAAAYSFLRHVHANPTLESYPSDYFMADTKSETMKSLLRAHLDPREIVIDLGDVDNSNSENEDGQDSTATIDHQPQSRGLGDSSRLSRSAQDIRGSSRTPPSRGSSGNNSGNIGDTHSLRSSSALREAEPGNNASGVSGLSYGLSQRGDPISRTFGVQNPLHLGWFTLILSVINVGLIAVSAIMVAHNAVSGLFAGTLSSQCTTPQLFVGFLSLAFFTVQYYCGTWTRLMIRIWNAPCDSYLWGMAIGALVLFFLCFAIVESEERMKVVFDEGRYWRFAHILVHLLRTTVLLWFSGSDVIAHYEGQLKCGLQRLREFLIAVVIFIFVSDAAFSIFLILEMPASMEPGEDLNITKVHLSPEAARILSANDPYFNGLAYTTPGEKWHGLPNWFPVLAPLWVVDIIVGSWIAYRVWSLTKKSPTSSANSTPREHTPLIRH